MTDQENFEREMERTETALSLYMKDLGIRGTATVLAALEEAEIVIGGKTHPVHISEDEDQITLGILPEAQVAYTDPLTGHSYSEDAYDISGIDEWAENNLLHERTYTIE